MRTRRIETLQLPRRVSLVLLAFWLTGVCLPLGAQNRFVPTMVQTSLSGKDFSQLASEISSGQLDYLPTVDVALWLIGTESGLSVSEREALIESILMRAQRSAGTDELLQATEVLLWGYEQFRSWTLRARLLALGDRFALPGMTSAVRASAAHLAQSLATSQESSLGGYEIEAVTLGVVAPSYPSLPLAELLRRIAAFSRDERVVTGARGAARQILSTASEAP